MVKKKPDRMSEGERLVWAAAFVNRLSDINDPMRWQVLAPKSERQAVRAIKALTMEATEFAKMAVNGMRIAPERTDAEEAT